MATESSPQRPGMPLQKSNPDLRQGTSGALTEPNRTAILWAALLLSLSAHVVCGSALMSQGSRAAPPTRQSMSMVWVPLPREPLALQAMSPAGPALPAPDGTQRKEPARARRQPQDVKPVPKLRPEQIVSPSQQLRPQTHQFEDSDEWVQPQPSSEGELARRAPTAYAEAVKQRLLLHVVRPANAVYPAPRGFRGDPRELMRECTIPYEIIVDRTGKLLSFEIEPCHDDLLDAAAIEAINKAQPFAAAPEGSEQYRIYGSVNFKKPRIPRATP